MRRRGRHRKGEILSEKEWWRRKFLARPEPYGVRGVWTDELFEDAWEGRE